MISGCPLSRWRVQRVLGLDIVNQAEIQASDVSIKELEKIAFVLGLDERLLAFDENAGGDQQLAFRLKTLQQPRSGTFKPFCRYSAPIC